VSNIEKYCTTDYDNETGVLHGDVCKTQDDGLVRLVMFGAINRTTAKRDRQTDRRRANSDELVS